ncbi:C2H2 type zinc-finger-domain-containing protein [Poronia punctata]|nr:C2H2 type zinc-finger-domain-containing protein [Poronia punctata]
MVGATTTTGTTTTTTTTNLPMSLSSSPEPPTITKMEPYIPNQCLFCPTPSPSFPASITHMRKSHGLFIPHPDNLAIDTETLIKYLHLIIFGYRECIYCGTERSTVQGVQQHMTDKGHCKFDMDSNSEFAEFYDFSEEEAEEAGEEVVLADDEDSLRQLPSGKIISSKQHLSSSSFSIRQRIKKPSASTTTTTTTTGGSHLEYTTHTNTNTNINTNTSTEKPLDSEIQQEQEREQKEPEEENDDNPQISLPLSRREKREKANITYQLSNMSANDRASLMHLPTSQQRALILSQHRQEVKIQKEERRRRGKIDRKGNKNLYAYWNTETPVYQCG